MAFVPHKSQHPSKVNAQNINAGLYSLGSMMTLSVSLSHKHSGLTEEMPKERMWEEVYTNNNDTWASAATTTTSIDLNKTHVLDWWY